MTNKYSILLATVSLAWISPALPQSVYKSVDAQGRVTYSSTPPPSADQEMVERVEIAPPPKEQERQAAEQRAKALQSFTEQARQQRNEAAAKAEQSKASADKALRDARTALEEARNTGNDD